MATDRFNLTIDIPNVGPKRVNVRSSLQVAGLMSAVRDKWNLTDGVYELRVQGVRGALPEDQPLDELSAYGLVEGSNLEVRRLSQQTGSAELIRAGQRRALSRRYTRVYLREQRTLREFDIRWQPAIIGRRDVGNPMANRLLAVDLSEIEAAPGVSRHHVCITESGGAFYLEDLQARSPVYINERRVTANARAPLLAGSDIRLGHITLTMFIAD